MASNPAIGFEISKEEATLIKEATEKEALGMRLLRESHLARERFTQLTREAALLYGFAELGEYHTADWERRLIGTHELFAILPPAKAVVQ